MDCENNAKPKKPMTDAERLELAKKLDDDLENFINSFEKRPYTEGWPEDRWEEEMEKHPFFMKKAPEAGDKLSPLMEGLQQLKYDPNENTPEELANSYKEDGNFNFKHKNYRLAIIAYTEAIKLKCGNTDIQATLYNNRSAAHYFLQNYRSSLKDAELALGFKPEYEKVSIRMAHCYYATGKYDNAIQICESILAKGSNDEIAKLRTKSVNAKKIQERDSRKKAVNQSKQDVEDQKLINAILTRGIQIEGVKAGRLTVENLQPHLPNLSNKRVWLHENDRLVWPVAFVYPEYHTIDVIEQFHEDDSFQVHLNELLEESPAWDTDKKYTATNVNLYVEIKNTVLHKLKPEITLNNVLKLQWYVVKDGVPSIVVLAADSAFEKHFLKQYTLKNE